MIYRHDIVESLTNRISPVRLMSPRDVVNGVDYWNMLERFHRVMTGTRFPTIAAVHDATHGIWRERNHIWP
jgi:hypothetical protein